MPKKGTNGERPGRAAKKPPVCGKWVSDNDPRGPTSERCRRPKGHSESCQGLTVNVPKPPPLCPVCGTDPSKSWPCSCDDLDKAKAVEPPKPAPPSQGSFKWLDPCPVTGCPRLRIRSVLSDGSEVVQTYDVEQQPSSCRLWFLKTEWTNDLDGRRIRSVRLKHYTVTFGKTWTCSCPDFAHRSRDGGCKHARALRAALAALPF
jgi:hypothetical protein